MANVHNSQKTTVTETSNTTKKKNPLTNENYLHYEQLKKILDNSFDEIYVVDGNGIVIYANEACERNYSLKLSTIVGKTVYEGYELGYCYPFLYPIILHEKKVITMEQETHNGKRVVVTATPILDTKGEVELIIMNTRDLMQLNNLKYDFDKTRLLSEQYSKHINIVRNDRIDVGGLISRNKQFINCIEIAKEVASVDVGILVLGESGTGKSLFAQYIHKLSNRKKGPFISINCAAIPDQLIESELFGYRRGAFTGANADKTGLFELANDGTLFLDEISEIPVKFQAKLLEVIQEKKFFPVGGNKYHSVNTRIIAATNRDITKLVEKGDFREDLYFRLNIIELKIPPLRERLEDIPLLTDYFLNKFHKEYKTNHTISNKCIDLFLDYHWPGNIRELQNLIQRLVLTVKDDKIMPHHLPKYFLNNSTSNCESSFTSITSLDSAMEELQRKIIISKYNELKSSYKVAKSLNISQAKAHRLIRKYCNG